MKIGKEEEGEEEKKGKSVKRGKKRGKSIIRGKKERGGGQCKRRE